MARLDEGFFSSKDNTRLFWRAALPDAEPLAMVAIVHGYADHSGRWTRVMDDLVQQGLGTIAFDYRGHGKADGARGDCAQWTDFLLDMDAFWARARSLASAAPCFVLAHSHGALIATHWALGRPEGLQGLVLSSPYYRLAFEPPALKLLAARLLKGVLPGLALGNELKPEHLSRDEAWQKATQSDPLYNLKTTPRWFFAHVERQQALASRGKDLVAPLLVVTGDSDPVAATPAARAFFETVGSKDKTWKEYAGLRHEVVNEVGRELVINDIARWILDHR